MFFLKKTTWVTGLCLLFWTSSQASLEEGDFSEVKQTSPQKNLRHLDAETFEKLNLWQKETPSMDLLGKIGRLLKSLSESMLIDAKVEKSFKVVISFKEIFEKNDQMETKIELALNQLEISGMKTGRKLPEDFAPQVQVSMDRIAKRPWDAQALHFVAVLQPYQVISLETQSSLLQIFHLRDVLKSRVKCSDADRFAKALRVLKIEVDQPKYITSTLFEKIKKHMDEGPVLFLVEKKTKNLIKILGELKVISLQEKKIFDLILRCQKSLDDFSEVLEILKIDREEGLSMPSLLPNIFETLYEEMENSFTMHVWDKTDILFKTLSQQEKLDQSLVKAYGPFIRCQHILSGMEPGKNLNHALEALGIFVKTLAQDPIGGPPIKRMHKSSPLRHVYSASLAPSPLRKYDAKASVKKKEDIALESWKESEIV